MDTTKGVVLLYEDLCEHWVRWCRDGGLTSLGVHKIALPGQGSVDALLEALDAPGGRRIIGILEDAGITVEYELHALEWLLPRSLFEKNPTLFRVNEAGVRTADCNLCPSSAAALDMVSENACKLAKILGQSSHRYFFWMDDAVHAGCSCESCKAAGYTGADQGILIANAIARGVKAYDPAASAAYLAYADAKMLPMVRPADNVFLEFAPMDRDHAKPICDPAEERSAAYCRLLSDLLTIFPAETTHVLEYWLDNALYSGYKMPPVKVPFHADVCDADTEFYTSLGVQHVKTFASYICEEYHTLHGEPPIAEYGAILEKYIGR